MLPIFSAKSKKKLSAKNVIQLPPKKKDSIAKRMELIFLFFI
jgi:hypothetical protein